MLYVEKVTIIKNLIGHGFVSVVALARTYGNTFAILDISAIKVAKNIRPTFFCYIKDMKYTDELYQDFFITPDMSLYQKKPTKHIVDMMVKIIMDNIHEESLADLGIPVFTDTDNAYNLYQSHISLFAGADNSNDR